MKLDQILFVGPSGHRDFREIVECLRTGCRLTCAATPESAARWVQRKRFRPQVILVAQSRPGQFSRESVESLHRVAPLARLVALAGCWCEGEARTGRPWPGVPRVYWHQIRSRIAPERQFELPEEWRLPRTGTDRERLVTAIESMGRRPPDPPGFLAIRTATMISFQGLAGACAQRGHGVIWFNPRQPPAMSGVTHGILDVGPRESMDGQLAAFIERLQPAPVVALVGFPRLSDKRRLNDLGVRRILAKPFELEDLWTSLNLSAADTPKPEVRTFAA